MKIFTAALGILICLTWLGRVCSQPSSKESKPESNPTASASEDSLSFLPPGTEIYKRTDGEIHCFLPKDTLIQGILCRGGKHHDWMTVFYANGKLALAWLPKNQVIQGVPCRKATFWTEVFGGGAAVRFHDNGKLAQCKLDKDAMIQGHSFKKGDHVKFDREGRLILPALKPDQ